MVEVALFAAPLLLLAGLLLLGRFPGERAILARRARAAGRLRPARRRWTPAVERVCSSELRTSHRLRGPPAFV